MTKRGIIKTLLAKQLPERAGLNEAFWPHIIPNAWQAQGIEPDHGGCHDARGAAARTGVGA